MYDSITAITEHVMPSDSSSEITADLRRFRAIKEHLFSELNGEGVILSMTTGKYYGLNSVGVSIWTKIQAPATLHEIEAAIIDEYSVDRDICSREVSTLLREMAKEGLVETISEG